MPELLIGDLWVRTSRSRFLDFTRPWLIVGKLYKWRITPGLGISEGRRSLRKRP